ncbi:mitochondrial large subunit ribosomal protein-domain-containing protein [Earliella scabrosa]|nr:mitochondrial large subunit ribosomal protein-domain-containing protein [Earliella scabrosa]
MLAPLARPLLAAPLRQARRLVTTAQSAPSDPHTRTQPRPTSPNLPYHVPRNTRGSIPVYTDIRNGGTKYLVLIRNVQGNIDALADDLARTLFPAGSSEAERISVETVRKQHVVVTGGRWKPDVLRWLAEKGF